MKTTPMDKLIYTTARLADDFIVFKQFAELLKTTSPTVVEFKEWDYNWASPELPKIPEKLWSQGHALCVFTDSGVLRGTYHNSMSGGTEPHTQELFIQDLPCYLEALMLFRRTETSFDVIPIIRSASSPDGMFPEFQLRFDWDDAAQAWGFQVAPTGFVNAYVYWPAMRGISEAYSSNIEHNLEWLSNAILRYLGACEAQLNKPGKWEIFNPKPARVTYGNDGGVKKIYRLGQVGYRRYVATK